MIGGIPSDAEAGSLAESLYVASLPQVKCTACSRIIPRRKHRLTMRASWRNDWEYLCPQCWYQVCQWAERFALQQMELPFQN